MPAPQFSPYISFPGNAAEAFAYYAEIFGGELELSKYDDFPDMSGFPFTPPPGSVAHAQLHGGLVTLAGGDGMAMEGQALPGLESDVYSYLIGLDTVEQAEALIEAMTSSGAEVAMPFELAPWGDHYGQVKDRYGVLWALVVGGSGPEGAPGQEA
ncbi:VOC family protein [Brachybacterium phenoliresistens]|uniref:Glyoxalase n=1 Tax=Brachybacterium phenoliresistens TaxID=396014 RepID=Z9JT46_9MICO|nr:VOC family protein [Brachybacterium phenoliresistens]EWS80971.1 glyoxalase [Brachybacterium phenoliresistens]